jgi:AbrB family looped-hinge helix DNA binding protein
MSKPTGKVGKKLAVYLPKSVAKAAGMKEGDKVEFEVEGGSVALKVIHNPLDLALHGKKFATMTAEEIEEISMSEQERYGQGPA